MEYSTFVKLAAEFFGTAILMIFGNGAVANVELKNTKGHHAGWLNIAMGYGFGVMIPVLMFGAVSGAHINPAMTIAQAVNGLFPWSDVLPYIVAQLLGALLGQLIVYITYYPHYKAYGNIAIMLPMITSVQEVRDAKRILEEAKSELRGERIDFNESIQIGVMIETPASVIMADELAAEVDFFSIGTNDLTQYTLACDRQNPSLERFADPHSPAVLRMIQMTIEAAHRHGIWCGICGELGADLSLTDTFLRLGIDELSVSPTSVLPLRNVIRNH